MAIPQPYYHVNTFRRLIAYWRDSLTDAELSNIKLTDGNHVGVSPDALERGQLDTQTTAALFSQGELISSDRKDQQATIPIVIAPIIAIKNLRGGRKTFLCPLLIPANLSQDGRLQAQVGVQKPWIPRTLLEPTSSDLAIGSVDALNDYFIHNLKVFSEEEAGNKWPETFGMAWEMLRYVTNEQGKRIIEEAGYHVSERAAVVSVENLWGMSGNILSVYNHLLDSKTIPPFLENYATLKPIAPQPALSPKDWSDPAKRHLGSFNNQFPLSSSQRQAIYHFLSLEKHSTLAVSGPPGTGKTTLLHSVIASLWVSAALQHEQPPVIVATSTNNQAVTNVIDSFSGSNNIERWLPVSGFGLYLVNTSTKQAEAEVRNILTVNKYGDGFPSQVETAEFINQAKPQYLAACAKFLQQEVRTLDEAITQLHQLMKNKATLMKTGIDTAFRLHELTEQINAITFGHESPLAYEAALEQQLSQAQQVLEKWQTIYREWLHYQQNEPASYSVLGFIPGIRRKREAGYLLFLNEQLPHLTVAPNPKTITKFIDEQIETAKTALANVQQNLEEAQQLLQQIYAANGNWQQWCERCKVTLNWQELFQLESEAGTVNKSNLLNWLDTTFRYDLFALATHYWEGRWLQEIEQESITAHAYKEDQSRNTQEKKWRRYAMLTPCFVTTMHTGPSFFDYYDRGNKPLLDYIDLLIIDEAGQVTPEVSGAMLALTRQALVVGDLKQIEPVWSIPPQVDLGNLQRHKLAQTEEEFALLQARGITSSSGSVMQMAQQVSPYQLPVKDSSVSERGMFLAEHRRCVPEIIEYCNTLAYSGRLRPMRPSLTDYPWPHLGYVHVKGQTAVERGSRKNEREAQALVAWIADNQKAFIAHYGGKLDDIIGIVTPFAAQKRALFRILKKYNLNLTKVGTVHTLQGGERPVVLFSPVYTTQDKSPSYFFDQGPNMLNVAVSRAKDSFVVFGDMDIFNPNLNTPSGILARYLFAREEHEVASAPIPEREGVTGVATVHHIRTLDKHLRTLSRAFERAQRHLVIVSPFLRWRAVASDDICAKVQKAIHRGVQVEIFVDENFNQNLTLPAAAEAATALRKSGAKVHVCHNVHSKVVCVDDEVFIEGSFNWLSAERSIKDYARYETSIIYTGPMVSAFIKETLADIQQRVINDTENQHTNE